MQTATVPGMLTGELLAGIVVGGHRCRRLYSPMAFFTEMLSTGVRRRGGSYDRRHRRYHRALPPDRSADSHGLAPRLMAWRGVVAAGPPAAATMLHGEERAQNAAVDRSRPSERTLR
jgi:hypothetical protein